MNRASTNRVNTNTVNVRKELNIKKIFQSVSLSIVLAVTLFICGCTQQEQTQEITRNSIPNTIAENAKISSQYSQVSKELSDRAVDIFLNDIIKMYRPTGHEEQIGQYIIDFAKANNYAYKKNDAGVVYFDVPASPGFENYPKVILQAHQDMVLSAKDPNADLTKFQIDPVYDKEAGTIHSRDYLTNIGADDAEGIITILALCENKEVKHGPLRMLFTTEEEETFKGAKSLTPEDLDAKYLINIDCGPVGTVITAAAGGMVFDMDKQFAVSDIANCDNLHIHAYNLLGGHSGESIDRPRLSAQSFMQDALKCLDENHIDYGIVKWLGGSARNAITNDASLDISVDKSNSAKAKELINKLFDEEVKKNTDEHDAKIDIDITEEKLPAINPVDSKRIHEVLTMIPYGMIKADEKGKPISSFNVGIAKIENGTMHIGAMYRTADQESLDKNDQLFHDMCAKHGISLNVLLKFPIWPQSEKSGLQDLMIESYSNACGFNGSKLQVHGGLECGYLHEVKPDLVMTSIGADVGEEHALTETLYTKSLPAHFASILYTLENINKLN